MERTDEAIALFKKQYGKTPKESGFPVIGFSVCRLRRSNRVLQNRAEYHPRDDVLGFVAIELGDDKLC